METETVTADPFGDGWVNPMNNPGAANAAIGQALATATAGSPMPDIPAHHTSGHVDLVGGFFDGEGQLVRHATVRELTGEHEERIAKARQSRNSARMLATLLECGVERLGDQEATPKLLRKLLIGDRDQLILEIRRATYGNELEFPAAECPHCNGKVDLELTLDDIPTRHLDTPEDRNFTVPLRRGRVANVRLPIGEDQEALLELSGNNASLAEQNTLLLSRTVKSFTEPDGSETQAAGIPAMVRERLSMPDRAAILKALNDRRPGPRYDELSFTHDACGEEVELPVTVSDLFLGL
ncbi:hypothetical protein [Actinomadura atramentaria]|uniref:T4 family baseplate hub assembly chaperone n=1 Tax=Actinomadura atramentaria TaxID=1990 RepID=UPI00036BD5FD|nr:hypothetical protein [Actinomadura atramentaria]